MSALTYLVVMSLLALAASLPSDAASIVAPTPRAPRGPAVAVQFLSAINAARADAGVPPLLWNATLAQHVKLHVNWFRTSVRCDPKQLGRDPIPLQESLLWFWRPKVRSKVVDMVAFWVSERQWYDRGTDACAAGHECGSYKLVVMPEWRQLGCALVACPSGGMAAACVYRPGPGGERMTKAGIHWSYHI